MLRKVFFPSITNNFYNRIELFSINYLLFNKRNITINTTTTTNTTTIKSFHSKMKLIDIGVNLCDDMFKGIYNGKQSHDSDVEQVIQRALDKHVDKLMITGTCYQDILEAVELIEKFKDKFPNRLYTTVGVHPTRCNEFNPSNDIDHRNALLDIVKKHREYIVVSIVLIFDSKG